ncbi:MAG: PAS domain S-box protein, partial [Candidatus Neomarinimicrobiota bacterium]
MIAFPDKLVRFFAAPVFDDRNKTRTAGLLNTVLWGGLLLASAAGMVNVSISPRPFPQFIAACALIIWLAVHLFLFRRGFIRLVSRLLPLTAWFMITGLVLFSGGIESPNLAGYIPLMLGVGLLFGLRYGIGAAVVNTLAGLGMLAAQTRNFLPEQLLIYKPVNVWAVYILWFTLTVALIHVGTKEITEALRQARRYARRQASIAEQQAAIARFGQMALETTDLTSLFNQAGASMGDILDMKYCMILELLPSGDEFLLRAGVGWREGLVGQATVEAGEHSLASYTLLQDAPVIVEDLRSEGRFTAPQLLSDHHVISGMSVVIRSLEQPFGVIGVYTAQRHSFTDDEMYFLDAIANILATAIERRQAEEMVRESEGKYRNILENIEEGYFEIDLAGNLTFFNDSMCRIAGLPREELMGMNNRDYTSPETAKRMYEVFNAIYRTGKPAKVMDYEVIRKDGIRRILEMSASLRRDPSGEPMGFRGVVRDVSERKQAEEALRVKDSAITSSISAIAISDLDGILTYVNPSFIQMWSYDDETEILGKSSMAFWQVKEKAVEVIEALRKKGSWVGELVARRKDDSPFDVQLTANMVNDETGEPICMMASFVDITERKRAEEELAWEHHLFRTLMDNVPDHIY